MSKHEGKYERCPHDKTVSIFEAVYYSTHHPDVEQKNRFIAVFAEEVVDYLENEIQALVISVRYLGTANIIL